MIDEQFLQRVYRSSIYWSLLIVSYLLMAKLVSETAGFVIGVAVSLAALRSIEKVVQAVAVPGRTQLGRTVMSVYGIVKYFIIALVIALVVRAGWISLPAFACGVGVPSAIIFLKTLASYFHELEFHPFWGGSLEPERVRETK